METIKRNSNDKIEEYKFIQFTEVVDKNFENNAKNFEFKDISELTGTETKTHDNILINERDLAEKNEFLISSIVRKHRGFDDQEKREKEQKITNEVERRFSILSEKAKEEGRKEGYEAGLKEVFEQKRIGTEEKLETLTGLISDILNFKENIISNEKNGIYKLIRNLTKWVILRELKDDGEYVKRLLEKLVVELQSKSNLLIQINEHYFKDMPDILKFVQKKLGEIENVRVEIDYDIDGPGMIIESDNGIINGTLKQQFKGIDKLFEAVDLGEEKEHIDLMEEKIENDDE